MYETWLHPLANPFTPYAAMLANHSHRREWWWQFRLYVTTASFCGARMGLLCFPDPSYHGQTLSPQTVWGAIANQRGCMVDVSGMTQRDCRFQIQTATTVLSNAAPPDQESFLGYSAAICVLYLLQAPIALSQAAEFNVTVLARCCVTPLNPIPGYMSLHSPILQNHTGQPPPGQPVAWSWLQAVDGTHNKNDARMGDGWCQSHLGGAWLAGGEYFYFAYQGGPAPKSGNKTQWGVTIGGTPKFGNVYTSTTTFPEWENNSGGKWRPLYFAVHKNPIHGTAYLVGFTNPNWAIAQASGNTGMVPGGAELCIKYKGNVHWGDFCPAVGDKRYIEFYSIYECDRPFESGQIYTSVNAVTSDTSQVIAYSQPGGGR